MDDKQIKYIYDATGTKLQKQIYVNNNLTSITSYAGAFIYEKSSLGGSEQLQFFSHAEGYVEKVDQVYYQYVCQYKDHLGNIRLSYQDMNNDGNVDSSEIKEENNYYPFGLQHKGYNNVVNGTENNYQTFMRQEKEEELGKNTIAFQWRDYDPAIGRFGKIDRFAEIYEDTSPYAFVKNNPILYREIAGNSLILSGRKHFDAFKTDVLIGSVSSELEIIDVGKIEFNQIDIADVSSFEEAGEGGASSAAVLVQEVVEQYHKAKGGGVKNVYPENAGAYHKAGITAENQVNGRIRKTNNNDNFNDYFKTPDGVIYKQEYESTPSGKLKVIKTKL
ncbi:cell well associated RhsD protein [Nonlabens tegetincola]|uniref:Cell well associated RhsD protein n=1 Tax=Nonlabens tegetincola TaxID=323273 RepID=A0A090Q0U6_9FLAO|nr:RHS repeat-associated core domain-containing protein [Nonlabens tegetincola]GAK96640.1 cell well associated RhsD protein [Nonlabens tegetincola]